MSISREWATPVTAGAFLLSAVTGVLMFFHADVGLNKEAHEWLGWVLLGGAALHVAANFAGFKRHLASGRGRILIGLFAVLLAASFFAPAEEGGPPWRSSVQALSAAPLATLAGVAQVSPAEVRTRLQAAGLQPANDRQSVRELAGPDFGAQMRALDAVLKPRAD